VIKWQLFTQFFIEKKAACRKKLIQTFYEALNGRVLKNVSFLVLKEIYLNQLKDLI